jgi:hypothetical protein
VNGLTVGNGDYVLLHGVEHCGGCLRGQAKGALSRSNLSRAVSTRSWDVVVAILPPHVALDRRVDRRAVARPADD